MNRPWLADKGQKYRKVEVLCDSKSYDCKQASEDVNQQLSFII